VLQRLGVLGRVRAYLGGWIGPFLTVSGTPMKLRVRVRVGEFHVGKVREHGSVVDRWVVCERIVRMKNGNFHLKGKSKQ